MKESASVSPLTLCVTGSGTVMKMAGMRQTAPGLLVSEWIVHVNANELQDTLSSLYFNGHICLHDI